YRTPAAMPAWHATAPVWPSGGGDAVLANGRSSPAGRPGTAGAVRAGDLPVWVQSTSGSVGERAASPPSRVHVQVAARDTTRAAGVDAVVLAVTRTDTVDAPGPVHLSLLYAGFADAFGGDWASRLTLVRLPACALTTPSRAECRIRTPLVFGNDGAARTLSAELTLPSGAT